MARRRPRIAFAAPLVVIAGCRRPVDDRPAPPPRAPDARLADAPVDAQVDAGRDAFAMTDDELRAFCARPENRCNPPPPRPPPDAALQVLEGRIIAARAVDRPTAQRRTNVTIAIGRRDGVQPSWRGELVRGERHVGTLVIESITDHATTGYTDVAPDELDRHVVGRLTPP